MDEDLREQLPEAWKLATMHGTAIETMGQAVKALAEVRAAIAALDARDDPPEYDPEADAADRADEWAAGQCELADIEAEEAER